MEEFEIQVTSIKGVLYQGKAQMVELSTTDGRIGIYANHIPLTVLLKEGEIWIHHSGKIEKIEERKGFALILPKYVKILFDD